MRKRASLVENSDQGRREFLEGAVGAAFEELVMAGVEDDEVGLVVDDLVEEWGQPVGGVGDTPAVHDLPGVLVVEFAERQREPGGERGFDAVGVTLNGRAAEDEDAPRAG